METLIDGVLVTWARPFLGGTSLRGYALKGEAGEVVYVDPPDPGPDADRLKAFGKPSHILVTFRDHDRAVEELAAAYGAKVWIPKGQGGSLRADEEYDERTELPAGLRALAMPAVGYGEHALYGVVDGKRVAFIGDAVFHFDMGRMPWLARLVVVQKAGVLQHKRSYRGGNTREALKQVQRLLELDLDALLVSHGEPVMEDARGRLAESLGSW